MSPRPISQGLAATLGLRQMIFDGELTAGDRVSELGLAERLCVSRTPLRLALAQLAHEGLLELMPGGGFAVRSFTIQQVSDAIELRGLLEGAAARLAAERHRSPEDLEQLISIVTEIDGLIWPGDAVEDFDRYVELNENFHLQLVALSDSDPLRAAYENVLALPFASPSAFVTVELELFSGGPESLGIAQHQHRDLLNALGRGEGTRAESIAREHARLARTNLDAVLSRSTDALQLVRGANLIVIDGEKT